MTNRTLPLDGLKVLDLTAHRAGPTAVRQLADWGADVIRIEAPGGGLVDGTGGRRSGPDFQNLHRNKRSLALNLKAPEGKQIFFELAKTTDVIVENFKSTVKYKLGIDYEAVKAVNRGVVYGSISGFGQDGPYAGRAGVDQIAQGMGGLMSITGQPGGGPMRVGIAINDTTAGLLLANAILIALFERVRSGEGQWVSTSLIEAQIFMLDFQAARYLMASEVPGQEGNNHPTAPGMGMFQTADGYINIAAAAESLWERFCKAADADDLLTSPEYATPALRSQNRMALAARMSEIVRRRPSAEWLDVLEKAGVPCGPINTIDKVFADPQVRHLGIAKPIEHPVYGSQKVVGQPIHLSRYEQPEKLRPSPEPGEHTEQILNELGYDQRAIALLREKRVV